MTDDAEIDVKVDVRMEGWFRLFTTRDGEVNQDTGWFKNLITDQGLDWFGVVPPNSNVSFSQQLIATHCGVGTGNTPPSFSDTQLTNFLAMHPPGAGQNVEGYTSTTYVAGPPAYWVCTKTYAFAIGAVVGNVSEVGVGNCATGNTQPQLFNHALILDGGGNPTTIPVTATDALTVVYEFRQYLDLTDNTYSMTIGANTYGGTYRRSQVNSFGYGQLLQNIGYDINGRFCSLTATNGTIGTVLQQPTGSQASNDGIAKAAYIPGTHFWTFTSSWSTASANFATGISALFSGNDATGSYQFQVSPPIMKTNNQTLSINWNVSWARYP